MPKWCTLEGLAEATGMSIRNLQYIRKQEPNVLVYRQVGKRVEYDLAACNVNLRRRERDLAKREAEPSDLADAERREAIARARLAEIKVDVEERRLVPIEEAAKAMERMLGDLRAQLLTFPQRVAPGLVGLKSIVAVQTKLDEAIGETMKALSNSV